MSKSIEERIGPRGAKILEAIGAERYAERYGYNPITEVYGPYTKRRTASTYGLVKPRKIKLRVGDKLLNFKVQIKKSFLGGHDYKVLVSRKYLEAKKLNPHAAISFAERALAKATGRPAADFRGMVQSSTSDSFGNVVFGYFGD